MGLEGGKEDEGIGRKGMTGVGEEGEVKESCIVCREMDVMRYARVCV